MARILALVALTGLGACTTGSSSMSYQVCDLSGTLSPAEAEPGTQVTVTGRPFSDTYDTRVTVGGVRASVVAVERADCFECDACRVIAECSDCATCSTCAETCVSCVETVTFAVPELAPGDKPVVITNRFGTSKAITLTLTTPETDTGTSNDTGSPDDTGSTDDTGTTDDTGSTSDTDTGDDSGTSDTGS